MNKSLLTNIVSILIIGLGYVSPVYSEILKTMGFYSFSGAITNYLAIHMLFEKVPFLYGSGVITERFEEFKEGIRNLIMNQFFTKENFDKFLSGSSSEGLKLDEDLVFKAVDFDKVFVKMKGAIIESPFGSMLGMFGGEQALEPLKPHFEIKFKEVMSEIISDENFIKNITSGSQSADQEGDELGVEGNSPNDILFENVNKIVTERLNELTPQMVKDIIQEMIRDHLGWLVVWGGVFGALIGLIVKLTAL